MLCGRRWWLIDMRSPANQIRMNGRGAARHYRVVVAALIAAVVSFTAGCQFGRQHSSSPDPSAIGPLLATSSSSSRAAHTLVVYIFSKTDTEYENNMRFFLRWGVAADDGCDYVIIIQTMGEGMKVHAPLLPPPPPRAHRIPSSCRPLIPASVTPAVDTASACKCCMLGECL